MAVVMVSHLVGVANPLRDFDYAYSGHDTEGRESPTHVVRGHFFDAARCKKILKRLAEIVAVRAFARPNLCGFNDEPFIYWHSATFEKCSEFCCQRHGAFLATLRFPTWVSRVQRPLRPDPDVDPPASMFVQKQTSAGSR